MKISLPLCEIRIAKRTVLQRKEREAETSTVVQQPWKFCDNVSFLKAESNFVTQVTTLR